ncbi:hypothetical protein N0V88_002606 [Collariella sp. IMI 366227]|nr:hypothetical protein N0V88_002606 [Collariella sp. IMI 366227]
MAEQALPSRAGYDISLPPLPLSDFPLRTHSEEVLSDCEFDCSENDFHTQGDNPPGASTTRPPRDVEEAGASRNSKATKPQLLFPVEDWFVSHGLDPSPMPPKKRPRFYRYLRWNFGSVYRRIFGLVFLGNMAAIGVLMARYIISGAGFTYQQASIAVTANILAAMMVRNEHVVNAMFWIFGIWTEKLPLRARELVAKVYSYGGIHSGGSVAATFWYMSFLVRITMEYQAALPLSIIRSYIYLISYSILFLLVSIIISAHPHLRRIIHNWFEGIHRFMGWLAVLLFWAQIMLLTADDTETNDVPFGRALLVSHNFWMLVAITLLVIYPWTRLRLRDVEAEVLSQHCVKLNFEYRKVHYGQAVRLTDAPLKETHAFGVIPFFPTPAVTYCPGGTCHTHLAKPSLPDDDAELSLSAIRTHVLTSSTTAISPSPYAGQKGFSVIISNAGDWTRKIISHPPKQIYTRGTPQFGVLRIAGLFSPCVIVATGSGIAPCLSLFVQKPDHPVRIIWSAKEPVKTYGRAVVELVYRADQDAVVIDTSAGGKGSSRPDLVRKTAPLRAG